MCLCPSDHYLQVLSCKQHCAVELALTAGRDKPFEDFLPSHFNYLQFSYYNSEFHSAFYKSGVPVSTVLSNNAEKKSKHRNEQLWPHVHGSSV